VLRRHVDVAGVLPRSAGGEPFKALPAGVLAQGLDGVPVQGDDAAALGALRRTDEDLVADAGELLGNGHRAVPEVDVAPPQPDRLTTAQPAQGN